MPRTVIQLLPADPTGTCFVLARFPSLRADGAVSPYSPPAPAAAPPFDAVGKTLFDLLARNPGVGKALDEALRVSAPDSAPISIYFNTPDAGPESPAWEAVYKDPHGFLALDPRWPISRIVGTPPDDPAAEIRRTFTPPLRVFAVLSAAGVGAAGEWAALQDAVKACKWPVVLRVLVSEDDLLAAVRAANFPANLEVRAGYVPEAPGLLQEIGGFRPHLLHFFCHGSGGSTPSLQILTRAEAVAGTPPRDALLEPGSLITLAGLLDELWLVTLNCCEGAAPADASAAREIHSFARALVERGSFPAVIGMRERIQSVDANRFCSALYRAITLEVGHALPPDGVSVTFDWAKLLVGPRTWICQTRIPPNGTVIAAAPGIREWTLPVIYVRPEPFKLSFKPAAPAPAADGAYDRGMLETLRRIRGSLALQLPPDALAQLDRKIAELEARSGP